MEWLIVIVVPENDFLGQINANNQTTLLLGVGAFFVALLMGLLMTQWVIKPIIKLNQASKNLAQGEWNQTTEVNRYDELGELEASFNFMANKLKESFSILQDNEHRLNQFLDAVPIGITVHEPTGKIYYVNQKGLEILEIKAILDSEKQDLSQTYRIYKLGTNQFYPTEELPIIRALDGETIYLDDLQIFQSEKMIPVEIWATPIYNHQGEIIYAIAAFQDISQRKQTEQILADYNRVLETEVKQRTTELAEAKDKAEVANRAKGIFLANMSHETANALEYNFGFYPNYEEFSDPIS
ncbi:MAG: HAMP domain-containing protein [Planktothrix sp. GU0601_MAG3]|nr:MAG: HAMP domain-containing protein [Planktothrix sp. GU0601_MAG3]